MNSLPKFISLSQFGEEIQVSVRLSNRSKHIAIRVKHDRVELAVPNMNLQIAYDFLRKKESWVRKKLLALPKTISINPNIVPLFGDDHEIRHIEERSARVEINHNIIYLYSPIEDKQKILLQFLQNTLLKEITKIVQTISKQEKLAFIKMKLSNSKSSWGRCTSHGILSFNWRLVFVPSEILHYVIIHEMCHLSEMNHSKKFWALVANLCPDYKAHKVWLKENSLRLHHYL